MNFDITKQEFELKVMEAKAAQNKEYEEARKIAEGADSLERLIRERRKASLFIHLTSKMEEMKDAESNDFLNEIFTEMATECMIIGRMKCKRHKDYRSLDIVESDGAFEFWKIIHGIIGKYGSSMIFIVVGFEEI